MENLKDNRVRNKIINRLRIVPKSEASGFVYELLDSRPPYYAIAVLEILRRISLPKEVHYKVLEFSLENCNVSSIKVWLKTLYLTLGYKRMFHSLKEKASSNVEQVEMSLYPLSWIVDKSSDKEVKLYKDLLVSVAFHLPETSEAMQSFRHFMGWLQSQYPVLVEPTASNLSTQLHGLTPYTEPLIAGVNSFEGSK